MRAKLAIQFSKSSFRWLSIPKYGKMVLIHNFHYLEKLGISQAKKPKSYPIIMLCAEGVTRYYHNDKWVCPTEDYSHPDSDNTINRVFAELEKLTEKSLW